MTDKPSPDLIEALMARVLDITNTTYWNVHQEAWSKSGNVYRENDVDDIPNPDRYPPMQLGDILVTHHEFGSGNLLFEYSAFDLTVSTWFDSKRMFYHAHLSRGITRYELVDWFERVIRHLYSLTADAIEKLQAEQRAITN